MTLKQAVTVAGLILALGAGVASLRADDKPLAGDLKALQGAWVSDQGPESRWVFEDDNLKATVNDQHYLCKVTLDAQAKPFATVDLKINGGAAEGLGKVSKGIYKFDGKDLVLCVGMPGAEARPAKFATVEDESYLFELKKEK